MKNTTIDTKAVRHLLILIFAIVLSAFTLPAYAQPPIDDCDPFALAALAKSSIPNPDEPPPDGRPETLWAQLRTVARLILFRDAQCAGLAWRGESEKVIGPVVIPQGLYRATATTDRFFIAEIVPLDGECGSDGRLALSPYLFNVNDGMAVNGAESLLVSRDCTALIKIRNIFSPWQLTFERIG